MKKTFWTAAALLLSAALLSACGSGSRSSHYLSNDRIERHLDYSEDLAWILFTNNENNKQWGAIDKTGKMVFVVPDSIDSVTYFKNGYSRLTDDNKSYIIDKTGTIVAQIGDDNNSSKTVSMIGYGEGNYVTRTFSEGSFDSADEYTYSIMTPSGDELVTFSSEDYYSEAKHLGKGVFQIGDNIYFPESGKIIPDSEVSDQISFKDDIAVASVNKGYDGKLRFINTKGALRAYLWVKSVAEMPVKPFRY